MILVQPQPLLLQPLPVRQPLVLLDVLYLELLLLNIRFDKTCRLNLHYLCFTFAYSEAVVQGGSAKFPYDVVGIEPLKNALTTRPRESHAILN